MRKKFNKKTSALAVICAMSILLTGCGNTTDSNRKWSAVSLAENVEAVATDDANETPPSIDTSTLEDCAYALPDPTGADAVAEQERFHTYLMDNFKESVTSDTVTLHYTVANPADYDLEVPTATFGDAEISEEAIADDKKETHRTSGI